MSSNSHIEWTDATWNPILGCDKISPGCKNCYAIKTAWRLQHNPNPKIAAAFEGLTVLQGGEPNWTGRINIVTERLEDPLHWREPRRVFVNSQSDLFHEDVPFEAIDWIYAIIGMAKQHTFQILTKRPARALEYFQSRSWEWAKTHFVELPGKSVAGEWVRRGIERAHNGVSCENQPTADERIPIMLQWPTGPPGPAVRWVSAEPLLGPINFRDAFYEQGFESGGSQGWIQTRPHGIDWLVAGGESGPGARPIHPDWARSLRDQCQAAGVPFFFKQHGEWAEVGGGPPHRTHDVDETRGLPTHTNSCFIAPDGHTVTAQKDMRTNIKYRWMSRIGKKAAGRLLDGKEHSEYPVIVEAAHA